MTPFVLLVGKIMTRQAWIPNSPAIMVNVAINAHQVTTGSTVQILRVVSKYLTGPSNITKKNTWLFSHDAAYFFNCTVTTYFAHSPK